MSTIPSSINGGVPPQVRDWFADGLAKARKAWKKYVRNRDYDKSAVYEYLTAVYVVARKWQSMKMADKYTLRALKAHEWPIRMKADPYARLIYCTSDIYKLDAKTRSKWARVMHYAVRYKKKNELFAEFVRKNGGLNKCAEKATG